MIPRATPSTTSTTTRHMRRLVGVVMRNDKISGKCIRYRPIGRAFRKSQKDYFAYLSIVNRPRGASLAVPHSVVTFVGHWSEGVVVNQKRACVRVSHAKSFPWKDENEWMNEERRQFGGFIKIPVSVNGQEGILVLDEEEEQEQLDVPNIWVSHKNIWKIAIRSLFAPLTTSAVCVVLQDTCLSLNIQTRSAVFAELLNPSDCGTWRKESSAGISSQEWKFGIGSFAFVFPAETLPGDFRGVIALWNPLWGQSGEEVEEFINQKRRGGPQLGLFLITKVWSLINLIMACKCDSNWKSFHCLCFFLSFPCTCFALFPSLPRPLIITWAFSVAIRGCNIHATKTPLFLYRPLYIHKRGIKQNPAIFEAAKETEGSDEGRPGNPRGVIGRRGSINVNFPFRKYNSPAIQCHICPIDSRPTTCVRNSITQTTANWCLRPSR